jgi:hypothetical protein
MSTTKIRELTDADLDLVSGAATWEDHYKECGGGLVPKYIDCTTMKDIYESWAQRGRDLAAGRTQF